MEYMYLRELYEAFSGENVCDWGHAAGEVKRLPLGDNSSITVCREHYEYELRWRLELVFQGSPAEFPTWEELETVTDFGD